MLAEGCQLSALGGAVDNGSACSIRSGSLTAMTSAGSCGASMTWTAIRRVLPTGAGPFATQQQPMHEHVWLPGSVGGAVVSEVAACGIVCDAIACAVIVADTIAPDVACTIECGASAATACCAGLPCPPCTGHSWIPPALHIASAKHGERKSPRRRRNQVWRIPDVKAPLSGRQCDASPGRDGRAGSGTLCAFTPC